MKNLLGCLGWRPPESDNQGRAGTTRMTISEYMHYQPPQGMRDELIDGELILSASPARHHADLCDRISELLKEIFRGTDYIVRMDVTMQLDEGEEKGNRPRPDVFVIDKRRWTEADRFGGYPLGSPQLAVEVLSPSTEAYDRDVKTPKYLAAGSLAVWLVDEQSQSVGVFTGTSSEIVAADGQIFLPHQMAVERTVRVGSIFEGIVK